MSVTIPGSGQVVVQAVQVTSGTGVTTSSTVFTSTGFSASITPRSTSNKILVMLCLSSQANANNEYTGFQLLRNGSAIITFAPQANRISLAAGVGANNGTICFDYLDSPAATTSTTYLINFLVGGPGTAVLNPDGNYSSITLLEVSGS